MLYKWLDASNQFEIRYSEDCVVKNPEQIELEVTFNTNSTPSNTWYNEDFYVNISINGASSYKWCGTTNSSCGNDNWLNLGSGRTWTMNRLPDVVDAAWYVYSDGNLYTYGVYYSCGLRPVVVLKPTIKLSGSGTPSQPFTIVS